MIRVENKNEKNRVDNCFATWDLLMTSKKNNCCV